jgi:hypothetical protein
VPKGRLEAPSAEHVLIRRVDYTLALTPALSPREMGEALSLPSFRDLGSFGRGTQR